METEKQKFKVYKVTCRGEENKFYSSDVLNRDWRLEYAPGKTTKAKPGTVGVFVFKDLGRAVHYASGYPIFEAWTEHEPKLIEYIGSYVGFWYQITPAFVKASFARRLKWGTKLWGYRRAPYECYVVPEITVVRRVHG